LNISTNYQEECKLVMSGLTKFCIVWLSAKDSEKKQSIEYRLAITTLTNTWQALHACKQYRKTFFY